MLKRAVFSINLGFIDNRDIKNSLPRAEALAKGIESEDLSFEEKVYKWI